MALVIPVKSTVSQAEGFLAEVPEHEFLRNRYFRTRESDMFPSENVLFDFDELDLKAGVFIREGYKSVNTTKNYFSTAVVPPRVALEDTVNVSKDKDRLLFERLCYAMGVEPNSDTGRADAYENLKRVKVSRMGQRVNRSVERECVNVLLNNGIYGTQETSDTDPTPVDISISYFDESEGNTQRYIPAHAWGSADATPYRDVCAMVIALKQHGGRPVDLLISAAAWVILEKDAEFLKMVQTYHSEGSTLVGEEAEGAEIVARCVFAGTPLNIITYSGMYEDEDGNQHQYLPDDFVCVLSPDCGRTLCGGCVDIDRESITSNDPTLVRSFVNRRGYIAASQYIDFRYKKLGLLVESRPLPAPKRRWAWITMEAMNESSVSEGTVGAAIEVIFTTEESGVTLPDDRKNVLGGSEITFSVPAVSGKTCDVYMNGSLSVEGASGSTTVTVPKISTYIEFVYKTA